MVNSIQLNFLSKAQDIFLSTINIPHTRRFVHAFLTGYFDIFKVTSKLFFNLYLRFGWMLPCNSCLPCVRVCYQLSEFKDSLIDSFIDSFEALFVLLFRYLFLISLRIVFPLKLHYFFTIFHYFIVFASELSNARISGLANTFARSSGSTSSATGALLFSCCTCICGSRFFFS